MSGQPWTPADVDFLRSEYATRTAEWIGRRLGRSAAAVLQKVMALRLRKIRCRRGAWRAEMDAFLREEVAAGRLDSEIAARWNAAGRWRVDRRTIAYYRQKLGIGESPAVAARRRQIQRTAYHRQMEVLGCQSLRDVYRRYRRRVAAASGWPLDCTPHEVRVLECLAAGRPKTRQEIALALGCKRYDSHKALQTSRGTGSVLSNLVRRGLLIRSAGRPVRGAGKGRSLFEYWLSRRAIEHHTRCTRRVMAG